MFYDQLAFLMAHYLLQILHQVHSNLKAKLLCHVMPSDATQLIQPLDILQMTTPSLPHAEIELAE
jgi:hypothetical protein